MKYNSVKKGKIISRFNQDSSKEILKIKCLKCTNVINKGEVIYHCECDNFIHPICYLKNINDQTIKNCPKCNSNLSIGIYELNQPNNSLNTGLRYKTKNITSNQGHNTNNTSNKSSISINEKAGSINSNILVSPIDGDETNEKSKICMDTNINRIEDYDKLCDNEIDIPLESMIEILNEKDINNSMSKIEENNNNNKVNGNNRGLNIRSTLINLNNKKNEGNNNNKTIINRVALYPITVLNTPYACNKRKGLSVLTSLPNPNNIKNKNMNMNNSENFINSNINANNNSHFKITFLL